MKSVGASSHTIDDLNMALAIRQALYGAQRGHRPFGCVIVDQDNRPVSMSYGTESAIDPIRHSEVLAIQSACRRRGGLLAGCTLYSTHEPCAMCCGAISHAKISRVVWGSFRDDLPGLFRMRHFSGAELLADTSHPPAIRGGVLWAECIRLFDREIAASRVTAKEVAG